VDLTIVIVALSMLVVVGKEPRKSGMVGKAEQCDRVKRSQT